MNPLLPLLLAALLLLSSSITYPTVNDALSFAYEGAEPYVRQGFTFREDAWGGDLGVGDRKAVRIQLFKGNEYWFITGTDKLKARVSVFVYDSEGRLVSRDHWHRSRYFGAFVAPPKTGAYWAIISVERSPAERTAWALVYGYR
ncbi:MAG: hypothetical protein N2035_03850 [Chthoniobacterales bacterium]|nr:hypothetical protein [Chthoniobacterales bacterium]MCX7712783.1 hypothetical protein [Chthoniobacterales bacterium]